MTQTRTTASHHRRFRFTEALLVAGILAVGSLTLLSDARILKSVDIVPGLTHLVR